VLLVISRATAHDVPSSPAKPLGVEVEAGREDRSFIFVDSRRLQPSGVTFSAKTTQFAFGVDGGIHSATSEPLGPGDVFQYTGRNEFGATLDLDRLAGMAGGRFEIRFEQWYGRLGNISPRTGAIAPAVLAAELPPAPDDPGIPWLTGFAWTQSLTDRVTVFAGKMSGIGAADQNLFAGGDGTEQFANMALIESPAFLLGIPYTSFSCGVRRTHERGELSVFVYDPADRTTEFLGLNDFFAKGIIVGSEWRTTTQRFGLPARWHVGAVWKHVALTDLRFNEPPPGIYPQPTVPGFPTLSDSWTVYYGFDQYFVSFASDPAMRKGWGLFGRASLSDGNPTPVRYFLSLGIGGDSRLRGDANDRWGIGWYYVGVSDQFGPLPQAVYGPRNGSGLEMYYNFQITRHLNVTPDVQFLRPESGAIAHDAFVYGVRANLSW
jgi:porin